MNILLDPQWWSFKTPNLDAATINRRIQGLNDIGKLALEHQDVVKLYRPEMACNALINQGDWPPTKHSLEEIFSSAGVLTDLRTVANNLMAAYRHARRLSDLTEIEEVICPDSAITPSIVGDRLGPRVQEKLLQDLTTVVLSESVNTHFYCEPSGHISTEPSIILKASVEMLVRADSGALEKHNPSRRYSQSIQVSHDLIELLSKFSISELWPDFGLAMIKVLYERTSEHDRSKSPFRDYQLSRGFIDSVHDTGLARTEGYLKAVVRCTCAVARGVSDGVLGIEKVPNSKPRVSDGANYMRARIQPNGGGAHRLHYYQLADGGVEFDKVVPHDDGFRGDKIKT